MPAGDPAHMNAQGASAIYLTRLEHPPATILEFLAGNFPHVAAGTWRRRMAEGKVMSSDGEVIMPETPYRHGLTILYFREVRNEQIIPFEETILFRNDHILIADKPHFLPVTPSGPFADECLLARLRRRTGLGTITPVHRLDRETAGLVIFSLDHETRPRYHQLFSDGAIIKEYLAIGRGAGELPDEFNVTSRIERGEPWFRMRSVEGVANATTHFDVIGRDGDHALFGVRLRTGKKHQIRLHLLSAGFPIVNDRLYPDPLPHAPYDFTNPLQLLAQRLAFNDPVTGSPMEFTSARRLEWPIRRPAVEQSGASQ